MIVPNGHTVETSRADKPILAVDNVTKHYRAAGSGELKAVDGVSLAIRPGETLGLVGESGCGKSTLARLVLRLEEVTEGSVHFEGRDLARMNGKELRGIRRRLQVILQDPYASLNPRMRIRDIILEPPLTHRLVRKGSAQAEDLVVRLLDEVGLPTDAASRFPHEFSGGQRQRICIARALSVEPALVVCDEAVSALDVSIQAQVLQLLRRLQQEHGMAYLFISHNLAVMRQIADRIAVMYLGRIVEVAETEELFSSPQHPYTQALLSAAPIADPEAESRRQRVVLHGEPPSPVDPPSGCSFRTRCPLAQEVCAGERPMLSAVGEGDHQVACYYPSSIEEVAAAQAVLAVDLTSEPVR